MTYVATCFITGYHAQKGQFDLAVLRGKKPFIVATTSIGLPEHERVALIATLKKSVQQEKEMYEITPGICMHVEYEEIVDDQLTEARMKALALSDRWEECTWSRLFLDQQGKIICTKPDKVIWKNPEVNKDDFLEYLIVVGPHMLPFLQNRLLTVKRYPNGVDKEGFYQKNAPPYTPEFIEIVPYNQHEQIVCNTMATLQWLGNQLAIEYHIPFNTLDSDKPQEIVFDLDPPQLGELSIATKAALDMKHVFDDFGLRSFVKLSGRKGIQVHLPLSGTILSYSDTRIFTEFIANYLVRKHPDLYTIERMKKNRYRKLYIDYIQHDAEKTIICPYSARETIFPGIAAPVEWEEVNETMQVENFSLFEVKNRVEQGILPFADYFTIGQDQLLGDIIAFIKQQ